MNGYYAQSQEITESAKGPQVEVLKYALQMHGFDYGTLMARNQLVRLVIGPLLDSVEHALKLDHVVGSETKYTLKLIIESERDIEMQ